MHLTLNKRLLAGAALAATVALGTVAPVDAATLRMAWAQDATGLDPHTQTAFSSLRLLELIYEPLVRLDPTLTVGPAIAESWEFSEDGTTLTFKLDPDAKFHDGTQVTSADVKASFERILDEATAAATRANFLSITNIDTPDNMTVVFNLSQPDAPILTAMTDINAAIVPASAIEAGTIGTQAIGSGPFKLDSWEPNAREVLSANPDWAGGEVALDGITITVLPDETAILASLRAGQTDFALLNERSFPTNRTLSSIARRSSPTTCCSSILRVRRWTSFRCARPSPAPSTGRRSSTPRSSAKARSPAR
jgi:peptide/nickel transport system substrate-binding protein